MKETEEIMGMIKEEGAAYFARERGNKVEVGLYLEHIIEERGMKKKDIVRKLNLEESYARKLFGGQRIPTRKILLQCAFLLSLDLSDTQRLLDIGQKPRLYPRVRYDAAIIYAADFVAPEGMIVLVENARARSITPNGNIVFWGMIDPPETIEIKEGKGTTTFFCQDMRSVLKGTGSDDKVIFCGQNNAIGGISGVENIYLRNNSHDLQVFGSSEFFNIYNETDNIKNNPQDENAFFIHIVNSKTAPVFHKTFDWGTGEFENENGEKWSSPYGIGIIYKTSDEKGEWEDIPVPAGTQAVKYDMSDEDIVEMLSRIWVYSEDGTTQDMNGKIWNPDKDNAVDLQEFRDCEGMSAKEIFEAWFDEKDPLIHIRTHNTNLKKRLAAYAEQYPDECCKTDTDPETGCMEFDIAKGRFSFRLTAPYSEERREAARRYARENNAADRLK